MNILLKLGNKVTKPIDFYPVDIKKLVTIVRNMKQKTKPDLYDINSKTLKELILNNEYHMELLYITINYCLEKGVFPNCLKPGKVIPLYKKGIVRNLTTIAWFAYYLLWRKY